MPSEGNPPGKENPTGRASERSHALRGLLAPVAARISIFRACEILSRNVFFFSIPAVAIIAASRFFVLPHAPQAAALLTCCGILVGSIHAWRSRASAFEAALFADGRLGLDELIPTALEAGTSNAMGNALEARAAGALAGSKPSRIAVFHLPWETAALIPLAAIGLFVDLLTDPQVAQGPVPGSEAVAGEYAAELDAAAARIEERFPESGREVAVKLRELSVRIRDGGGDLVGPSRHLVEEARRWESEASALSKAEKEIERALEESRPPGATKNGAAVPADPGEIEKAVASLRRLAAMEGLGGKASQAASGAAAALDAGHVPRFMEDIESLAREHARIRETRMVLEAAALKSRLCAESVTPNGAGEERHETAPPAGGGPQRSAGLPDRGNAGALRIAGTHDPVFDEAVRRYFEKIGQRVTTAR